MIAIVSAIGDACLATARAQEQEQAQAQETGGPADAKSGRIEGPAATATVTDPGGSGAAEDPAAALAAERDRTRADLEALSAKITVSEEKAKALKAEIEGLARDQASLREAMVDAAAREKALEGRISDNEKELARLRVREDGLKATLRSKRGLLAEVLGALERMGRDPPPALLVTPDDALSSVRSAILLGAVVPEMRNETDTLIANLRELASVRSAIDGERRRLTASLTDLAEEKRRSALLLEEKRKSQSESERQLAAEQRLSEELAGRATNLQDLIGGLEDKIGSVRAAAEAARQAEEARRQQTAEEIARAKAALEAGTPDKNRIAPAYAFSDLKQKLVLPVAGDPVRWFGDDDGTGHPLQGMMVAARAGTVVTAPADGWVVYAGPFRSYGQLLILNAGDGYHLVLAGMDRVDVTQGQFVVAGEPVAAMGQTKLAGAAALALVSDEPTLYIEFRKDGKPVDPKPWWSAKISGRASNGT